MAEPNQRQIGEEIWIGKEREMVNETIRIDTTKGNDEHDDHQCNPMEVQWNTVERSRLASRRVSLLVAAIIRFERHRTERLSELG